MAVSPVCLGTGIRGSEGGAVGADGERSVAREGDLISSHHAGIRRKEDGSDGRRDDI